MRVTDSETGLGTKRARRAAVTPPLAALGLLSLWFGFVVERVSAQDAQEFHPAVGDGGFLGVDGTRTPGSLRGSAHLFVDLAFDPVRAASGKPIVVDQRFMLHVGLELGLWGRGAVALRLPMLPYQHTDLPGTPNGSFALTDPQLMLRYRFLGASMADRDEPHDGPGMALQVGAALPFGKGPSVATPSAAAGYPFASDGRVRSDVALVGDLQLLGAGISGTLGWRHHFWERTSAQATSLGVSDQVTFGAALKLPIPAVPVLAGVLELRGASGLHKLRDTPLELGLGVRLTLGDIVIVLGGGFGLTHALGTPTGRLLLGVYGVLPEGDQDHDGIADAQDKCVFLAEDIDGFEDSDGCPDPDNDNDLVPDLEDKCPSVAAEEGRDEDEDGCTDPAPSAAPPPPTEQPSATGVTP
jgi:OOP family OmpA-OmpF porin